MNSLLIKNNHYEKIKHFTTDLPRNFDAMPAQSIYQQTPHTQSIFKKSLIKINYENRRKHL